MKRLLLILAALASLAPTPALAWWDYGHATIAAIAYRNVTPKVRATIDRMLARSALLDTPACPARTIEEASNWAECVKTKVPRFADTYAWHYQNVNICQPFDLKPACKDGHCVSAQIERDAKILKDAGLPLRERIQALAFLIHFVGDLHQPLHAGDRGDRGGSDVAAAYGIFPAGKYNLHFLWDGPLAERAISTPPGLVRLYSRAERASIVAGTVTDWSRESWQVARDIAYASAFDRDPCGPVPPQAALSEATIARLVRPVRLEMLRAGLRLARLLDEALGSSRKSRRGP